MNVHEIVKKNHTCYYTGEPEYIDEDLLHSTFEATPYYYTVSLGKPMVISDINKSLVKKGKDFYDFNLFCNSVWNMYMRLSNTTTYDSMCRELVV